VPAPGWLVVVGFLLVGTACGVGESPTPTEPTVPVLVIVTATPGVPPSAAEPRAVDQRYVVREGDSLSIIADRFNVSEGAIMAANGLEDPDRILVGQELVIPPPEP
jgi:LysM repeat protein